MASLASVVNDVWSAKLDNYWGRRGGAEEMIEQHRTITKKSTKP